MSIDSVSALVKALQQSRILEPTQLEKLAELASHYADPRAMVREMVLHDWITPYQANQLFHAGGKDLVLGPYVLLARISEAAFGQVFKTRHRLMNRLVALTVIKAELLARPEAVERFYMDTQAASQLSDPHIVHAYDAGPVGQTHFFAMEFVEGVDLDQLVQQSGPLPVPIACEFIRQTAMGLHHAHERGMAHYDLKPSNLLVTRSGNQPAGSVSSRSLLASAAGGGALVKIRNLGLTFLQPLPTGDASGKSLPDYVAPERMQAGAKGDFRADLYGLGCSFYFLLTGRVPFPGGSAAEKMRRHQTEEPVPLALLRKDVPGAVVAVVTKLMAKRPENRYRSLAEVVQALA